MGQVQGTYTSHVIPSTLFRLSAHILIMKVSALALVLAFATPTVYGWGASGHKTVALEAMEFLTPKTLRVVKESLGPTYNYSLAGCSSWADEIRSQPGWGWSSELHFVDSEDSPPESCSVNTVRDCPTGNCILGAIANYTQRVVDKRLSADERQIALKFLDHFLGDIGQPLHVEALAVGGNTIFTKCHNDTVKLHALWDTSMINILLNTTYKNDTSVWAKSLVSRIRHGAYSSTARSWISCSSTTATEMASRNIKDDITELLDGRAVFQSLNCPMVWARESNSFNCPTVFAFTDGQDLCAPEYYNPAIAIIEKQIAKQGFRLAAWLNVLFDGEHGIHHGCPGPHCDFVIKHHPRIEGIATHEAHDD
ncbi:hypothetical protein D9619_011905 [Psilocybe cf. subviscida]|uniref:Nuclease Le1 n=1 Tax=Psilocybe cf. subviscida TaxID=2480587 RepID=A0A8H5EWB0_9AGAR|nr:hypothetical protein D9619_011905 [Psilocybe cf. subviscida]